MKKILSLLLSLTFLLTCGFSINVFAQSDSQPDAIDVLTALVAKNVSGVSGSQGDIPAGIPSKQIRFNDTSYALLNETGDIVRINRLDEIDRLYSDSESESRHSSNFNSTDDVIKYIEESIAGPAYKLTARNCFDETTISLRYEKELSNGALDNFDSYSVFIDVKYNELVSLYKRESSYVERKSGSLISSAEACDIASRLLDAEMSVGSFEVELATVKTNNNFNESGTTGGVELAYIVKNEAVMVYVDAYTGEVIGGDYFKAVSGGAAGATELSAASDSAALVKSTLQSMGYNSAFTWKNAFGISSSSGNKAFPGWSGQVAVTAASSQGDDLPVSFTGDRNYKGYYE